MHPSASAKLWVASWLWWFFFTERDTCQQCPNGTSGQEFVARIHLKFYVLCTTGSRCRVLTVSDSPMVQMINVEGSEEVFEAFCLDFALVCKIIDHRLQWKTYGKHQKMKDPLDDSANGCRKHSKSWVDVWRNICFKGMFERYANVGDKHNEQRAISDLQQLSGNAEMSCTSTSLIWIYQVVRHRWQARKLCNRTLKAQSHAKSNCFWFQAQFCKKTSQKASQASCTGVS